jgi:hypothetical protein
MSGKYWALSLLALGIFLLVAAARMDSKSSFDDGSFLLQIVAGLAGAGCIAVACIWFAVLFFMGLS